MTDAREIIGRAIADYEHAAGENDVPFERDREDFLIGADAILSALAEAGYVVVPKDPTAKMVRGAVPPLEGREPIRNIYAAMIRAAQEKTNG